MNNPQIETNTDRSRGAAFGWSLAVLLLILAEMAALSLVYKHGISFECLANAPGWFCRLGSGAIVSGFTFLGLGLLYIYLNPKPFSDLIHQAGTRLWPLAVNGLGFAITWIPLPWLSGSLSGETLSWVLTIWGIGTVVAAVGAALFLAPLPRWRRFFADNRLAAIVLVLTGALAPLAASEIRPLWQSSSIADVTFAAVETLIGVLGYDVVSDPVTKRLAGGSFGISVAPVCSGVEGMALIVIFISVYLLLFRNSLRFPLALILYPIGLLSSFLMNIVRITVLMIIGLEGNPTLAVGGFHSHAGWILFILLSIGFILLAQSVPAFQSETARRTRGSAPPWRQDAIAARLVPFIALLLTALISQTIAQVPGVLYPLRMLVVAGALAVFWPIYRALPWRGSPDVVAVLAGVGIAAYWVLVPAPLPDGPPPFGTLSGGLLVGWIVVRGLGTTCLIPLVEELFFRDYLETRLRLRSGLVWAVAAALVSAAVFAALHGRWVEAFVASLIFSGVRARRGRITDSIWAHAIANGLIFGFAVATGQIHII